MRIVTLLCIGLIATLPGQAAAGPEGPQAVPSAGCIAPVMLRATDLPRLGQSPPPLHLAMLSCPMGQDGPRKRRLHWT